MKVSIKLVELIETIEQGYSVKFSLESFGKIVTKLGTETVHWNIIVKNSTVTISKPISLPKREIPTNSNPFKDTPFGDDILDQLFGGGKRK